MSTINLKHDKKFKWEKPYKHPAEDKKIVFFTCYADVIMGGHTIEGWFSDDSYKHPDLFNDDEITKWCYLADLIKLTHFYNNELEFRKNTQKCVDRLYHEKTDLLNENSTLTKQVISKIQQLTIASRALLYAYKKYNDPTILKYIDEINNVCENPIKDTETKE